MAYLMTYKQMMKYNRPGIYSISIIYPGEDGKERGRKLVYVGQSKNMYKRIQSHVREMMKDQPLARKYQLLHNYWLTTQEDANRRIQFDVLEYCEPEDLDEVEQEWIDYFKPCLNTVGMNDNKTIDQRIAEDSEIFWILELPSGWFNWEE